MGREIERKYLVDGDAWRTGATGDSIRQGYLSTVVERTVRVRVVGDRAFLTVKGITRGATRSEYEYEIPFADGVAMLDELCERPLISKVRYRVVHGAHTWEIDEFLEENEGLLVAEVELEHEDEDIVLPPWAGDEVTHDARFFNASLIAHPFRQWDR